MLVFPFHRTCPADCKDCLAERSTDYKIVSGGGGDEGVSQTPPVVDSRSNSGSPASSR